ncbi:MAG: ATP-binding protein [Pseudomonadota bacterium]
MRRLTFSLLAVVITAVIGLGWAIDQWYNSRHAPQEDQTIKHYQQLGKHLISFITLSQANESTLNAWAAQSSEQIKITPYAEFPVPQSLVKSFETGEPIPYDFGSKISLNYFLPQQKIVVSLNFPSNSRTSEHSILSWILTLLFYSGVILLLLLWLYPLLNRLNLLRRSAREFGAGNLSVRIARGKVSYISDIEKEFNRMAQKIENLISDNKLLSRGLSHDLRTPLARLRFGLDVLEEEVLTDKQQKTLAHLNQDLIAMESLVETLLKYARLEQANIALSIQPLNIQTLLQEIVHHFYDGNIEIQHQDLTIEPIIAGDAEYLAMLLHNLLQNAERHGKGKIRVSLLNDEHSISLSVEDNGSGIPVAERNNVLKPFYRAKAAQNTQGHGMGLAIVDRISQWHKAEVKLAESQQLGGLKISIIFLR